MSSRSVFGTTTRPCTRSSITVSPSRGALSRRAGLTPAGAVLRVAVAPGALDDLRASRGALLLPGELALGRDRLVHLVELGRRQIAVVGVAGGQQLLGDLAVARRARELVDGLAVPVELEPFEPVEDGSDGRFRGALAVGVLDAQQELAAGVARVEPVEQRRARPADMQVAGGRGSKAGDDGFAHVPALVRIVGEGLERNARRYKPRDRVAFGAYGS